MEWRSNKTIDLIFIYVLLGDSPISVTYVRGIGKRILRATLRIYYRAVWTISWR